VVWKAMTLPAALVSAKDLRLLAAKLEGACGCTINELAKKRRPAD